jgi:signal transduction histidine kinase
MRERVTALGGTMHVISPPGGPTTISVELPCAS